MMTKILLPVAALGLLTPLPTVAGVDLAQSAGQVAHADRYDRYSRWERRDDRRNYRNGYREGRRDARRAYWRGRDGRYYCRRDDGTTGLLVGGVAGGLIGNEVAGRGDKTLGTVLGAIGGGLLGREIDRGGSRCR